MYYQRILICDKIQVNSLIPINCWTVWYMNHLSVSSHTRTITFKYGPVFIFTWYMHVRERLHSCSYEDKFLRERGCGRLRGAISCEVRFLPRCMECRHGIAMRKLSVCLSVKRVDCDKTKERSVQIFMPYKKSFSLVFWEEEWLLGGGDTPSTYNFGSTGPNWH